RVPLHLALERFDTFDGREWTHSSDPEERNPIRLEIRDGKPWAYLMSVGESPIHRGLETHAVKIINLKTNRFPSPSQLTAVHVDKVDQLDFFGWTGDGVAQLPVRDYIPQLTVAHLRSQGIDLQPLRGGSVRPANKRKNGERQAGSGPQGWPQVEAVVARLRKDFVLDPDAPPPEDCQDVVAHFLRARRGPDYLFATAAAVQLRELGYETRLVTGFYARADRFDHRAGQTAVLAEDVHAWVEVNIGGRTWVAIEPTPGYEPPSETLAWLQRLAQAWSHLRQWLGEHLGALALGLAFAVIGWFTRVRWLDRMFTLFCSVAGRVDSRRRALWTIRLLEWRAWLAGHPRPRSKTLSHWHGALGGSLPERTASCLGFALRSAESLLYASHHSSAGSSPPDHDLL
ncbi:MAG: transglutaminase-like domain-containing protein, partial [Planctomycetota bacterium]